VDILNVDDLWGCYEGELEEEVAVLSKEGRKGFCMEKWRWT
jgi:hypothetical protein